ncbi:hypothetical protein SK128_006121, partial [Halocaridina rubra]
MSDQSSTLSPEDRVKSRSLPTEEFALAGNPNPVGIPLFRDLPGLGMEHQEETASLLGSQQYVYYSSSSETYSTECFQS